MLNAINEFMSKIASGWKTNTAILVKGLLLQYFASKGMDVNGLEGYLESLFTSINGVLAALTALAMWFRQLGKRNEI